MTIPAPSLKGAYEVLVEQVHSRKGAYPTPTLRQYEVLVAQVTHGSENAAARALGLSPYTVRNQLASLRLYWGAHHTTHLVALVYKHVGDIFVLGILAVVVGFVWWMA